MPGSFLSPSDSAESALPVRFNQPYVLALSLITALGGLLFGFDLAIVSGTVRFFSVHFGLSPAQTGWAVGCINLGALAGAALSGQLADRFGRKYILIGCAALFALTGVGTGWAGSFPAFICFRIGSGAAIGTAALVCPMYIAEIAPPRLRGRLVSCYQLAITLGILAAYLSDYLLLGTGAHNWRWMFSSQSAPALVFLCALFALPESPRWLIARHRPAEAGRILERIGGARYAAQARSAIGQSFEAPASLRLLFSRRFRPVLWMGIMVASFSQLVGQNAIFSYAQDIFRLTGVSEHAAFLQSVILGLLNLIFTFVSIATIDKTGRKRLLCGGAFLLGLDAAAIGAASYFQAPAGWVLACVLAFVAIYAATLGPATWVMLSELFPNRIRASALSLATLCLWLSNFLSVGSFPLLKQHLGLPLTYGLYGALCLLYAVFVLMRIPETKGRSLEEIEKIVTGQVPPDDMRKILLTNQIHQDADTPRQDEYTKRRQ